jgi:hypothetical protein
VSVLMNAPANVQSVSVPSTASATTVKSLTGLVSPVYPGPHVYVVVSGQISADPADIPQLFQAGFRVVT